jgi:nucleoside-diphosphate-sugar epimerase
MPAISSESSPLVLVTGANGFLAMHVVQALLEKGYRVRGTVRSESKTIHIRKTFAKHGDKLEFAIVEDITTEGAFDQAVVGVDAIAHTAATVGHADDPQGPSSLQCGYLRSGAKLMLLQSLLYLR